MSVPEHERYIYLYTSSEKQKQQYADMAKAAGVPLSKFLLSKIEESFAEKPANRAGVRELEDLRGKVVKLQAEVQQKDLELQQTKALLERQRNLTWLDDDVEILKLNVQLVEALKNQGPIHEARLLETLGVDPADLAMTRAISIQIELLEEYGMIRKGTRGWRWLG
jgi:hypothetical protein